MFLWPSHFSLENLSTFVESTCKAAMVATAVCLFCLSSPTNSLAQMGAVVEMGDKSYSKVSSVSACGKHFHGIAQNKIIYNVIKFL